MSVHRLSPAGDLALEAAFDLDGGDRPSCALFFGDMLYVAGQRMVIDGSDVEDVSPFLTAWDLSTGPRAVRVQVPLPALEHKTFDKRDIDALAVDEGRLLAFDNVMVPVYVFVFDLADPRRPSPIEAREISHGLWARIVRVALSSRFIIGLQVEGTGGGPIYTLTLMDRRSWETIASVSAHEPIDDEETDHEVGDRRVYTGIAVVDDVLFIAGLSEGLGRVDLRALADLSAPRLDHTAGDDDAAFEAYSAAIDATNDRFARAIAWSRAFGARVLDVRAEGSTCVVLAGTEAGELIAHAVEPTRPFAARAPVRG